MSPEEVVEDEVLSVEALSVEAVPEEVVLEALPEAVLEVLLDVVVEDEEELFFLRAEKTEEGEVYSSIEDEGLLNAIADAYEKEFIQKMKAQETETPEAEA